MTRIVEPLNYKADGRAYQQLLIQLAYFLSVEVNKKERLNRMKKRIEDLTFKRESGDTERSIGVYNDETKVININLEYIVANAIFDLHNMPHDLLREDIPSEYLTLEYLNSQKMQNAIIEISVSTLEHEYLHKILDLIEGKEACTALDNFSVGHFLDSEVS